MKTIENICSRQDAPLPHLPPGCRRGTFNARPPAVADTGTTDAPPTAVGKDDLAAWRLASCSGEESSGVWATAARSLPVLAGHNWLKKPTKPPFCGRTPVQPSLLNFCLQKNVTNLHAMKIRNIIFLIKRVNLNPVAVVQRFGFFQK